MLLEKQGGEGGPPYDNSRQTFRRMDIYLSDYESDSTGRTFRRVDERRVRSPEWTTNCNSARF
jgi:hypothetical protein